MIRRRLSIFFLIAIGITAGLGAGCGQKPLPASPASDRASDAGEPVNGDWLIAHLSAEPAVLNPILDMAGAVTNRIVNRNIYEFLLIRNSETLEYEPMVAESWEVSEDHLVYTFHIRQGITFSDGVPLTAHDVAFTFGAILNPKNDTADIRSYFTKVTSAEATDDYTFVITCNEPYFLHLSTFADIWVLPKHIFETEDLNTHPANRKPVGSGPYEFEEWKTGSHITLTKRASHWSNKLPYIDKIRFTIIDDRNAAFLALQRGDIDEIRVTSEQWATKTSTESFEANFHKKTFYSPVDGYVGTFGWIGWNSRRPYFSDKRVRRAMTMLLDRETILEKLMYGLGRVVTGYDFPDSPEYNPNVKAWPYDPEAAWKLLDEAGWKDTDNDGIRDKDGVPFKFEWIYGSGNPVYERMSTVYKEQLDKAGIQVTLRPLEWATFLESVVGRNFDACMMAWVSPPESDPYQIWHTSQAEKGSNYVGFGNAESDKLIEDARLEFDRDKRVKLYHRFHEILHEEQPYTFLYNSKRKSVVSKRFRNVKAYPQGYDFHEWWVPKDEQRYP